MSVELITHNGKKIVYGDFKECNKKEKMIEKLYVVEQLMQRQPGTVLYLADLSNTHGSTEFMKAVKEVAKRTFDHKVEKAALIGIIGIKKVLLNGFNAVSKNKFVPFDNEELALKFLTD
ncbi:hypothetical protein [Ekhidna sp.]|uniref:hypothetical protein n=1 Tax=Ekhidna sp. TaxID=2608089 RepID=UPI003297C5EE